MTQQQIDAAINEQYTTIMQKQQNIENGNDAIIYAAEAVITALAQAGAINVETLGLTSLVALINSRNADRAAIAQAKAAIEELKQQEADIDIQQYKESNNNTYQEVEQ